MPRQSTSQWRNLRKNAKFVGVFRPFIMDWVVKVLNAKSWRFAKRHERDFGANVVLIRRDGLEVPIMLHVRDVDSLPDASCRDITLRASEVRKLTKSEKVVFLVYAWVSWRDGTGTVENIAVIFGHTVRFLLKKGYHVGCGYQTNRDKTGFFSLPTKHWGHGAWVTYPADWREQLRSSRQGEQA